MLKDIWNITWKACVGLAVLGLVGSFLGINIFALLSSPWATVKGLVTPAKA